MSTLIVSPLTVPDDGLKYEVAAKTDTGINIPNTERTAMILPLVRKRHICFERSSILFPH
jgi:hypothetical protein